MTERRVVITGLGVVAAGSIGAEPLFQSLLERRGGLKRIDLFDASGFPCQVAGQLDNFSAGKFVPKSYRKAVKVMARDIEIAVAAADLAVRDSGLITAGIDDTKVNIRPERVGCNIGAGLICADLDELGAAVNSALKDGKFDIRAWGAEGMKNLTPLWLLKYLPNMLSCHVTIIHQTKGPSNTITCGECSGHLAVGEATRTIARGACDLAIAGGAESKVNPMGLLRQGLMGRLNTTSNDNPVAACKPFDAAAAGTIIGEGGGLLILEEAGMAKARSARVYAEVAGFGAACDPDGVFYDRPTVGGLALAIAAALKDAGVTADQIDLVIPHGTGVPAEDAAEVAQLRKALGDRVGSVPMLPVTGAIGNLFAGAGPVHLAVGAMALHRQMIPPAVNFEQAAPSCLVNVPRQSIAGPVRAVLCASHGVGGQAAALVLKRYEP